MCGFLGIFSQDTNLKKYSTNISHRGNDEIFYQEGGYLIYYTRLATDNVFYKNKEYVKHILYNGIIYNTSYLIEKFGLDCENFDSILLKEGYKNYGKKFLENVRGMFTFAFYNKKYIELIRDNIGIKPLYYIFGKNIFAFCSEIKGLVDIGKKYNLKINEVFPGEIIKFDIINKKIIKDNFYYKNYTSKTGINLIENSFKECLLKPTKKYLKSGKKIAVLLSGGLDSSILLYYLLKNGVSKEKIEIFSMGLEGSSDYNAIKLIEKDLNIKINYIKPLSEEKSLDIIEKLVYISESFLPRVIKVSFFQYQLAKEIRKKGIDIVISGEGADEIFYGYDRFYKNVKNIDKINSLFKIFFEKVFFYTLLQRLDRSFSYFTLEARVPFLDQELVYGMQKGDISNKLKNGKNKYVLRKFAKQLGLPLEIVYRKKEKMTKGITGKDNNYKNNLNGYLENIYYYKYGKFLSEGLLNIYKKYFYLNGENIHSDFKNFIKEEDLIIN